MQATFEADLCSAIPFVASNEPTRFNPATLENLCHKIGEVRAEAEVALALNRLSEALPNLPSLLGHDMGPFKAQVDQIVCDADLIGMSTLARVASNVSDSCDSGHDAAIAATLARLQRVGDRSIHAVWDLEDISI